MKFTLDIGAVSSLSNKHVLVRGIDDGIGKYGRLDQIAVEDVFVGGDSGKVLSSYHQLMRSQRLEVITQTYILSKTIEATGLQCVAALNFMRTKERLLCNSGRETISYNEFENACSLDYQKEGFIYGTPILEGPHRYSLAPTEGFVSSDSPPPAKRMQLDEPESDLKTQMESEPEEELTWETERTLLVRMAKREIDEAVSNGQTPKEDAVRYYYAHYRDLP